MSGVEALGAVASATQLVAYVSKLILAINDVIQQLKDAPRRLQERMASLHFLASFLDYVSKTDHYLLNTNIRKYLFRIQENVNNLLDALETSYRQITDKSIRRYWKALAFHKCEEQILKSFAALENDKSSLLLFLTGANGQALCHIQHISEIRKMSCGNDKLKDPKSAEDLRSGSAHIRETKLTQIVESVRGMPTQWFYWLAIATTC